MPVPQEQLGFNSAGVNWDDYMRYRPEYPQSFYDRINPPSFDIVNDCGAGGGVASAFLAKKFNKVIVSEPNNTFLSFARQRLKGNFEFLAEGAEKSSVPSGTLDALTIFEALHWCDIPTAMKEFHRQLKAGGVLSIGHYGKPYMEDEELQKLWQDLWLKAIHKMVKQSEINERSARNLATGYDDIEFSEDLWENVHRVMINTQGNAARIGSWGLVKPGPSLVGKNERQEWREKDAEWTVEKDLSWFKELFYAMVPWEAEDKDGDVWKELENATGQKKIKAYFPATQFATKR